MKYKLTIKFKISRSWKFYIVGWNHKVNIDLELFPQLSHTKNLYTDLMMDAYRILFILLGIITPFLLFIFLIFIMYCSKRCLALPRFQLDSRPTAGLTTERSAEQSEAIRNQSIQMNRLETIQKEEIWPYKKIQISEV